MPAAGRSRQQPGAYDAGVVVEPPEPPVPGVVPGLEGVVDGAVDGAGVVVDGVVLPAGGASSLFLQALSETAATMAARISDLRIIMSRLLFE
ncbi:hypothetical protein [Bordetella genomosp. 13]|uniref:hypothetical protein n=1 Tax=Bordetella genomosp. 13 TaxID=463040 RepID=UPI0012FBB87B|nr:hypothetical protein [Bordetella genomosp. 13]